MLDSLRNFGSSWFGKVMMGFLLIGLAGFGISGVITSIGSTNVARVGGQDISIRDFQRAYNAQLNAVAQQTGTMPTNDQAMAFGLPSAALNRLAADAAMSQLGDRMGLGASATELGKMLREDPNFGGVLGQFDQANFQRALQQNGYTESEYLKNLKGTAQRQQLVQAAFGDFTLPETALEIVGRYTKDTRTLRYFTLAPSGALPPAAPTDDELAAYLKDHQGQYRTLPERTADFLVLSPDVLASGIEVADTEIAAEYDRTKANYVKVETRDVRQVSLQNDKQKLWFERGLANGKSFDTLLAQTGLPFTDLGTKTEAGIVDADLAKAAFGLADGAFALVPGPVGMRVVTVSNIVPGGQQTLDEVKDQIALKLKNQKAKNQYVDVLDQIESLRAAMQPMADIAKRFGLTSTELTITSSGGQLQAIDSIPPVDRSRVADTVFKQELGNLAPGIPLGSNLEVWFDLKNISEARDQTLDEVRQQLVDAITSERVAVQLEDDARKAVADIKGGQDFDSVAVNLNATLLTSAPFARDGKTAPADADLSGDIVSAAFDGAEGLVGYARNAADGFVVFKVTTVTPATAADAEQARTFVENSTRDDLYAEFVASLRDDAGVHISQQVLSQVLGLNANGQ